MNTNKSDTIVRNLVKNKLHYAKVWPAANEYNLFFYWSMGDIWLLHNWHTLRVEQLPLSIRNL